MLLHLRFIGIKNKEKINMDIKSCGKNKVILNGKCIEVVIIPVKELTDRLKYAEKALRKNSELIDMDQAQDYGYEDATVDLMNWAINYKQRE
jgi:hypothetical protein